MASRWMRTILVCCSVSLLVVPAASAQVPGSPAETVAAFRSAVEGGNYVEAFRLGIAGLEAFPEAAWERNDLETLVDQLSYPLFKLMSRDQQQAAVLAVQMPPITPLARAAMLWANWMAGNRAGAWEQGLALINQHPNSYGAGRMIEGGLLVLAFEGKIPEARAMVLQFGRIAPENPSTAWAVCHLSWWLSGRRQIELAKDTNTQIIQGAPDTLSATVAGKLNRLVEDVEALRYAEALERLAGLREYWRRSAIFEGVGVVHTFLIGMGRAGASARAAKLTTVMNDVADTTSDRDIRDFALCVLGLLHRSQGKTAEAKAFLERVLDGGAAWRAELAMTQLASMCARSDPQRAIALLERCRAEYGAIPHVHSLGKLYTSVSDYSKGLEVFTFLETLRRHGQIMERGYAFRPRIGMMVCLNGDGRENDAKALANQLLEESRYGIPLSEMTRAELEAAARSLEVLGRDSEAAACDAERSRKR